MDHIIATVKEKFGVTLEPEVRFLGTLTGDKYAACDCYRIISAGKTTALKMLEDARYFCVDNLPIPLMGKFVSLMAGSQGEEVQNAAIGIDARSGRALDELEVELDILSRLGQKFEILFLDADDRVPCKAV